MPRLLLFVGFLVVFIHGYGAQQVQMPEAGALYDEPNEDLSVQVQTLQRNISELWTYIHALRTTVTQHLNHLRQHQVEMESTVRKLEHGHDGQGGTHAAHTDDHHHSGEPHSHSGEHHSHSGEHHHSGEQHHHSGEEHSHGGDQHSHSGEHHSHDSHSHDTHSHDSHSHSHDGDGSHSHDTHSHDSHSHSHDGDGSHSSHEGSDHSHSSHSHKDSHETEDDLQQSQQVAEPLVEPLVVPTHNHQHPHSSHRSSSSTFKPIQLMGRSDHYHHHHHHDHHPTVNRTRTPVVMPKFSEYALYDFAVCNVQPNRAIPEDQQQEVVGQISFWQRKTGGSLNIHVKVQGFSMGDHHGAHQAIQQEEEANETPNPSGHKHGFHIHSNGDLSNGCQSTGPHFNPKSSNHGGSNALVRHVGDLGNIECDEHGLTNIVFSDGIASLKGPYSILGKSAVIHASADDYGLGGDDESLRTGNAGTRIACCIIEKVDKLPIRSYKAIKAASQYQN